MSSCWCFSLIQGTFIAREKETLYDELNAKIAAHEEPGENGFSGKGYIIVGGGLTRPIQTLIYESI